VGDDRFAPIFDELNRRKATVFVHPTSPPCFEKVSQGYPAPMIEYPFENTRMVVSLLRSDTLSRCPDVKIIVPHGGGTIPYLAPRIANLVSMFGNKNGHQDYNKVMQQLCSLYYDLTAATHHGALLAMKEILPLSQLLMGFDFPFMPAVSISGARQGLKSFEGFTKEDRLLIKSGNASQLIKNLKV
jgi:predicted TIM-barrel fold metal-dependent hydrolase